MSRIVLVGCVAQKQAQAARAADLYTSPLWQKRRAYAEATGDRWLILSAKYGLVTPDTRLWPYEQVLKPPLVTAWADTVAKQLVRLQLPADAYLEIHAGVNYVDGIRRALRISGLHYPIDLPLRGLGIGEQLKWYGREPNGATL